MKMLKSKNIRRICVLLAMLAPVVYLFGSLFSALSGAHGTEVFAEPVYVNEWVEAGNVEDGKSYKFVLDSDIKPIFTSSFTGRGFRFDFDFNGNAFDYIRWTLWNTNWFVDNGGSYNFAVYSTSTDTITYYASLPWVFLFEGNGVSSSFYEFLSDYGTLYVSSSVPSSVVPENAGAYSDYVFKNFFAKDNFLEQIGKDVLSETPHGFVPFAMFWKYLDNNMLHMGDMQLGLMGYGYVYYCCHVLLFDIAFILVTFFLDFIQKVNDKVVGGVD